MSDKKKSGCTVSDSFHGLLSIQQKKIPQFYVGSHILQHDLFSIWTKLTWWLSLHLDPQLKEIRDFVKQQ